MFPGVPRRQGGNQCGACVYLTKSPREVIKEIKMHSTCEVFQIYRFIYCRDVFQENVTEVVDNLNEVKSFPKAK